MPGKRQPEPQMLRLEMAARAGRRWLHAAGSPQQQPPVPARRCSAAYREKEGEGSVLLRGCVLQLHVVLTPGCLPSFLGRWGEARLLCAFTSNGAFQTLPHLAVGHRGLGPTSGQVSFPPPCSSSPCLFSAPLFNKVVYSSPDF